MPVPTWRGGRYRAELLGDIVVLNAARDHIRVHLAEMTVDFTASILERLTLDAPQPACLVDVMNGADVGVIDSRRCLYPFLRHWRFNAEQT